MLLGIVLFTSLEVLKFIKRTYSYKTKYFGLGFTPLENGLNFAVFGLVAVLFQVRNQWSRFSSQKRFSVLSLYRSDSIFCKLSKL